LYRRIGDLLCDGYVVDVLHFENSGMPDRRVRSSDVDRGEKQMTMRVFIVALLILQSAKVEESGYYQRLKAFSGSVNSLFIWAADSPFGAWGKLSTPQGKRVVDGLVSDAETLYVANKRLYQDLGKARNNHTEKQFPIESRVNDLRTSNKTSFLRQPVTSVGTSLRRGLSNGHRIVA
jgi:hypothetical protein